MTRSPKRCITVEHFDSDKKQEDADAQRGTAEQSLRDVLRELKGVLGEEIFIDLREISTCDRDSLTVNKSEAVRIACKELGIASLPLDEILNPNFGMSCCAACPYQANSEACCRIFACGELDSNSIPMALIVAAILNWHSILKDLKRVPDALQLIDEKERLLSTCKLTEA